MSKVILKSRECFKEKYDFDCCVCGAKLWAEPSIMMTGFGINSGHGCCTECKTFLHLEIYPDIAGEYMVSKDWDEYLKEKKVLPKGVGV